jgi:hypothetical protein
MSDLRSLMGYSKGSPWENAPYNLIKTSDGRITMANTKKKLKAYDAKTGKFLSDLEPGKEYKFNVKNILEIPSYQKGGPKYIPPVYSEKSLAPTAESLIKKDGLLNFFKYIQSKEYQNKIKNQAQQTYIGPTRKLTDNEKIKAKEQRIKLNSEYIKNKNYLSLDEDGNIINDSKYLNIDGTSKPHTPAAKFDKFASSLETPLAIATLPSPKNIMNLGKLLRPKNIGKNIQTESNLLINEQQTLKNLEDLQYAKEKFGSKYRIPENLDRIAQSKVLTDRTIRGLVNRDNTFVRGVSTNWKELEKYSPSALEHLKKVGIDYIKNPKQAAEYMATHIPPQTGYGRAGMKSDMFNANLDGLYTSNSKATAEGYTYGDGYMVKVKKPTDFSSTNRQEWIEKNKVNYIQPKRLSKSDVNKLDEFKMNNNDIMNSYHKKRYEEAIPDIKKAEDAKDWLKKQQIEMAWAKKAEDDFNKYAAEQTGLDKKLGFNIDYKPGDIIKTSAKKTISPEQLGVGDKNINIRKIHEEILPKLDLSAVKRLDLENDLADLAGELRQTGLKSPEIAEKLKSYLADKYNNPYAHYIHLGNPGQKIFEPISSTEMNLFNYKNKSRAHTGTYSKGLSAAALVPPVVGTIMDNKEFKNGGEYSMNIKNLPKYQWGGDCPEGFTWSVADQQCMPIEQLFASNYRGLSNKFITGALNPQGQRVGGTGATEQDYHKFEDNNQSAKMKRMFGTPNIPAIVGSNLLAFGLSSLANNVEQGRQKAFMMKQMNDPAFNGSFSNAQNDYGVDPYEQTGQLRPQYQKGGTKQPIYTQNPNDPRLRAYNDSLSLYNQAKQANLNLNRKLPVISKEKSDSLAAVNAASPLWQFDKFQYDQDKKNKKPIHDFNKYVFDGAKDSVRFERNISIGNNDDVITLPDGTQKHYITKDKKTGKVDKSLYDIYDPQTGTSKLYSDGKLVSIISDKIKPIQTVYRSSGKKELLSDISTSNSSTGWYDSNKPRPKFTVNASKKYQSYYTPVDVEEIYQKPVQPVVYQKPQQSAQNPSGYDKRHPPIYLTNSKDPRIGQYAEAGNQYLYKKPVSKPRPTLKPVDGDTGIQPINLGKSIVPDIAAPNLQQSGYDASKPTDYSFTNATGNYLEGKQTYFPDEQSLRAFAEQQKGVSIQSNNKGATATGYLKMQSGGSFNPIDFLYDDEEDSPKKQEQEAIKKAKKPRITEQAIDNDEQLAYDILNMDSPARNRRSSSYISDEDNTNGDYALMYLKHQQGAAGINAIKKAADQGLTEVPRNWSKENIQFNMQNNVGKDFKGKVTPASFIDYWSGKFNRHMKSASQTKTPYDNIFQKVGEEEGLNPLFLKTVAKIESNFNPNNNTKSKYKGLFAINSNTFKGNVFDPYQSTKAAAQNFKRFEQGGEFTVDFNTMRELQAKGIKFKIID